MREIKRFSGVAKTTIVFEAALAIICLLLFPANARRAEGYYGYGHIYRYTLSDYLIMVIPYFLLAMGLLMIAVIIMQLKSTVVVFEHAVKINAVTGNHIMNIKIKKTTLPFSSIRNAYAEKQGIMEFLIIETGANSLKIMIKGAEEAAMLMNQLINRPYY